MNNKKTLLNIAKESISELNAGKLLQKELANFQTDKKLLLISIGKAAWQMAETAIDLLGNRIEQGFVITKYHHLKGEIKNCKIYEAGHPFPDKNSLKATDTILKEIENISEDYEILFLISGGGSSLFEKTISGISLAELIDLNQKLINSGATINEINTVRKHVSAVKGGRFAQLLSPRKIHSFILSDVIGDDISMIASGPVSADQSTSEQALELLAKYNIRVSENVRKAIQIETPKSITNAENKVIGNVELLCRKAAEISQGKGFEVKVGKTSFRENLEIVAEEIFNETKTAKIDSLEHSKPVILIFGGEPIIKISGNGKGGRNQHLALLMAKKIAGMKGVSFLSIASDGTDGPTDAAGGFVDENTFPKIKEMQIDFDKEIEACNSYFVLSKIDALKKTGPTGTNVNDLMLVLIDSE
ncbi:MAG: DUF4147 domain-containing protein [Candidatus Cloacimonetes bacterium]|nr:DUF4147 domain-containing protein [Candidatus Cloacimonadota bacterium]MCF7812892.1 DUF4147 domain-containing protein [Candidatus Cloacimonadota bacterium]MCF7867104.1 DUF4147 domain-containing protein [Candidatus Cloacimonadota bacterium]MCF7882576.1 DUF4147 domain-containing protein [Candidatus Cloacimonadota bacterium]